MTTSTRDCRACIKAKRRNLLHALAAGGFISTIWSNSDDLHPSDFGDNDVHPIGWSGACLPG